MKFSIQKENIYNGLNIVSKATATRAIQPVLSNVLIETIGEDQIKISATDFDISIIANIPAMIMEEGSITLPAKKLSEIVSKLPEKAVIFNLNPENNQVEITCEKSRFDLNGIAASEFPPITIPDTKESIDINVEPLLKAIKQTVFSAANYDTNNVLSGVFCKITADSIEMAATDGNRLSRSIQNIENPEGKEYSVVIPSRTLSEFARIISGTENDKVNISVKAGEILFKLEDRILFSRLLEGQYPKYQQLIPEDCEKVIKAQVKDLASALERTATMVNERTSIIKFYLDQDKLNLMADTPDLGDSSDLIEVEYEGEEFKIAFNYKYILDALKVIDSETVRIELKGSLSATVFKPDNDEDYLCLIMPVQIK